MEDCLAFDDYPYGLTKLPPNLAALGAAAGKRYAQADITYLWGAGDVGPANGSASAKGTAWNILNKSCMANIQGTDRLGRGKNYLVYGEVPANRKHRAAPPVDGCAHDVECVFGSKEGMDALFPQVEAKASPGAGPGA
jgi:hypothetical protein